MLLSSLSESFIFTVTDGSITISLVKVWSKVFNSFLAPTPILKNKVEIGGSSDWQI